MKSAGKDGSKGGLQNSFMNVSAVWEGYWLAKELNGTIPTPDPYG